MFSFKINRKHIKLFQNEKMTNSFKVNPEIITGDTFGNKFSTENFKKKFSAHKNNSAELTNENMKFIKKKILFRGTLLIILYRLYVEKIISFI